MLKDNKINSYFYNIGEKKLKLNEKNLMLFTIPASSLSKILIYLSVAINLECYSNLKNEKSLLLDLKKLLKIKNNLSISNFSYINNFTDNFEKISEKIFINFKKSNGFFYYLTKKESQNWIKKQI